MEALSWFVPILPGKLEAWKASIAEIYGPRMADFRRSRERLGISRELAALVQTPQGDFASIFLEAEDLAVVFEGLATSNDPFDVWFRQNAAELHGLIIEEMGTAATSNVYFDYRSDAVLSGLREERAASADTD